MVEQEGKGVSESLGCPCKPHMCSSPITDDVSESLGVKGWGKDPPLRVRSVALRESTVPDLPVTDWIHSTCSAHNTHKVLTPNNPVLDSPVTIP